MRHDQPANQTRTPTGYSNRPRPPSKISWPPTADARLARMHFDGLSTRMMALAFGLSRSTIADRAGRLGLAMRTRPATVGPRAAGPDSSGTSAAADPARDPLPAGHELTWGLITQGTSLAGAAYVRPDSARLRPAPQVRS